MTCKSTTKLLFMIFLLSGCSIDIIDDHVTEDTLPLQTEQATALEQPGPKASTDTPEHSEDLEEVTPVNQLTDKPVPTQVEPLEDLEKSEVNTTSDAVASTEILLRGQIYYIGFTGPREQSLLRLDLSDREESSIFIPPENAWLSEVVASPDGSQLLLAYSPPPEEGEVQFGFTNLYLMPADGSREPIPLLQQYEPSETYFHISWPIDDMIYFAHVGPSLDEFGTITFPSQIGRLNLSNGQTEFLVTGAAWPRISDDGTMMAFVTEENNFLLAEADGSNPKPILDQKTFNAIDAPLFTPDNKTICFSAVLPTITSLPSIWDRLMGVKVVLSHNVPSDWWCVPVDGSEDPQRLTNLNAIGIYGDFDDGGRNLAFKTAEGINIINPDSGALFQLREIPAIGTIAWVTE